MSNVLNVAGHPVDLDNGRTLGIGEEASDVDTDLPHNRQLVVSGALLVTEGKTPRKTQPARLVRDAANNTEAGKDN